jgi:hypothetical protein
MKSNISLNGLMIAEVPNLYNFQSFIGNCGYSIFSASEIINHIKTNSCKLKIDFSAHDQNDLPKFFSEALESNDANVKNTAEDIVADFGRRLGLIVYILKTATVINRHANNEYEPQDWQSWKDCSKIFLAGGLANGLLGEKIRYYAQELLYELNINDSEFILSKFPSYTQMIGCARLNKEANKQALLFDFGHSFVKAGFAVFNGQALSQIKLLPKLKSQYMNRSYSNKEEEYEDAIGLHNFIVKTISDYYLEYYKTDCSKHIVISIANNVENGKIGWGGCYYKLMFVSQEYERYLENCLTEVIGVDTKITLIHDGQAASVNFSDEENSVLIALGTAFGVGYPEPIPGLKDASCVEIIE